MATLPLILGRAKLANRERIFSGASYWISPATTFSLVDRKTGTILSVFTRASTATYFDRNGILRTAAVDEPVIEWDPATGVCLGWRIWDAVVNGHIYTEDFTNAAWTKFGGSMSANIGPSPDGGTNADGLVETTGVSETHGFQRNYSFVSGTQVTLSIFASKGSRNFASLSFNTSAFGGTSTFGFFDLTTGAVSSSGNCTTQVQACPNGVYRCSITATPTVTTTTNATYRSANTGSSSTYTGNGSTAGYFWGAQINTGPLAPYVPATGAVTASSTADVASILSWAAANNIRSAYIRGRTQATGTRGLLSGNDNTGSNRIEMLTLGVNPRLSVRVGGTSVANTVAGTIVADTTFRIAARFNTDDFASSLNGAAVVTDTSGALPTIDRWFLGRTQAGEYGNCYLEEIALFTGVLNDFQLQALTA